MARRINKPQQEITEAAVVKATVAESPAIIAQTNHNQELQSNAIPAQTGQEQQARQEIVSPVMPAAQPEPNGIQVSANTTKPVQFEYFAERHAQVGEKLKAMLELNKTQYVDSIMAENNLYAHKAYAEAWKLLVKEQNPQKVPKLAEDALNTLDIPLENKAYVTEQMRTFVNACTNNIPQCLAEYVAPVIGEKVISINTINAIVNDPLRDYEAKQFTPSAENSLQLKEYLLFQIKMQIDAGKNIHSIQLFTHATTDNLAENFNTSKKGEGADFNYTLQYLQHLSSDLGEKGTTILINNLNKTADANSLQHCLRLIQYDVPTEKILTMEYAKLTNEFNTLEQEKGNLVLSAFGISYTIPKQLMGIETLQHMVLQEIAPYWYSFYSKEKDHKKLDQIKFDELAMLMQYVYTSLTKEERASLKGIPHDRLRTLTQEAIVATLGKGYELYSAKPSETTQRLDLYSQKITGASPEKMTGYIIEQGGDFIKPQMNSGSFYTIPTDQVAVLTNIDGQYIPAEKTGLALTVIKNNMDYSQFTVKDGIHNPPLSARNCELFANKSNNTYYLLHDRKQILHNGESVVFTAQEVATLSNSIDMITPAILQIKQAKTVKEAQQALKEVKNWEITARFLTSFGQLFMMPALSLYEAMGHEHEDFLGYNPKIKEERLRKEQIMELLEDKNLIFD